MADLNRGVTSRLFQKQSVEEIVTDTLRHYGYRSGVDFVFNLRGKYKRHEYVTQYHETTFAFIQRICAQEGIWFRWEQKKDHTVIVFGDDLDAYARRQRTVPYQRFTMWHKANAGAWPQDAIVDFEADPESVGQVKYAVRSACFFWVVDNLYGLADQGNTQDVVDSISKVINPGLFKGKPNKMKVESIDGRRGNFSEIHKWGGLE
ncbi:hypothetical protein JCM10599A_53880 [Paraburkholderia kururiensis]